jgi:hypothetical protein
MPRGGHRQWFLEAVSRYGGAYYETSIGRVRLMPLRAGLVSIYIEGFTGVQIQHMYVTNSVQHNVYHPPSISTSERLRLRLHEANSGGGNGLVKI